MTEIKFGEDNQYIRFFVAADGNEKVLVITDAPVPSNNFSIDSYQRYVSKRMGQFRVEVSDIETNIANCKKKIENLNETMLTVASRERERADRLYIHVVAGRDLPSQSSSVPAYTIMCSVNSAKVKTKPSKKTFTPVWNQYLELPIDESQEKEILVKFDVVEESFWGNTLHGNAGFTSKFEEDKCYDVWLPIFDGDSGAGEIRVVMQRSRNCKYTRAVQEIKSLNNSIFSAQRLIEELNRIIAHYESFANILGSGDYNERQVPLELALYFSNNVLDSQLDVPLNILKVTYVFTITRVFDLMINLCFVFV